MAQELLLYTLLYVLFLLCLLYPPAEFITAGFTIQAIFSPLLGSEKVDFVEYHIKRTTLTSFIHSCLPLLYFLTLSRTLDDVEVFRIPPSTFIHYASLISFIIALVSGIISLRHYMNGWISHPIVYSLQKYSSDWKAVADNINTEYKRLDIYSVTLTGIDRIVMTNSWILSITSYSLMCAQVSDVTLEVIRADEHPIAYRSNSFDSAQFVNIRVRSTSNRCETFVIRIDASSLRDIQEKLNIPIAMAQAVVLRQSLSDRFVGEFAKQIANNPIYHYDRPELLEPCLGCASVLANVKLIKNCRDVEDDVDENGERRPNCLPCYCRPMWCDTCMARIFAAKQDAAHPENWMPGKASCPTCRAVFCVFDVSSVGVRSD